MPTDPAAPPATAPSFLSALHAEFDALEAKLATGFPGVGTIEADVATELRGLLAGARSRLHTLAETVAEGTLPVVGLAAAGSISPSGVVGLGLSPGPGSSAPESPPAAPTAPPAAAAPAPAPEAETSPAPAVSDPAPVAADGAPAP